MNIRALNSIFKREPKIDDLVYLSMQSNIPERYIKLIVEHIESLAISNDKIELKTLLNSDMHWLLRRSGNHSRKEIIEIAIKMYLSVGLDNSLDILNGKYGSVDYEIIYFLFNNLDLGINSKEKEAFNDFLFANKKDPNNTMRLILNGELIEIFANFDYFYNSIKHFIDKIGYKLNKSKVILLLKERYVAPILENPELSGDILNDMLQSYYHRYGITDSEAEIIDRNIEAYKLKLKTKTKSSIIKTNIPQNGEFTFELLPLADARNLVMGYRSGNCFRINGDAFCLFDNFLTNPHMRILSISTDEYKDFGMVLLMRNGNVLIAQGIELSSRIPCDIMGEKLYNAVKDAINYIMAQMNNESDEIVASVIGLSNNNTAPYNHNILPFLIKPILESNTQYYNGIANYQALLSLKEGKRVNDIKLFIPDVIYNDNSITIYRRDKNTDDGSFEYREIEKILMSLRFARFKDVPREQMMHYYESLQRRKELYTICTYDWFITVFEDGSIETFINSSDPDISKIYYDELTKISDRKYGDR